MKGRLVIDGLACGRAGRLVVPPLALALEAGEALLVTGENGAGKSTLLRTLAGFLPPLAGTVRIEGWTAPDGESARRVPEIAHYLGHRNALKGARRVGEELEFWARFLAGPPGLAPAEALERVGLGKAAPLRASDLSAGQARRVALARLLVAPRPVWLLDEPTAALDTAAQSQFSVLCRQHLEAGGILVATTHQPLDLGHRTRALHLESMSPPLQARSAHEDADEGWEAIR